MSTPPAKDTPDTMTAQIASPPLATTMTSGPNPWEAEHDAQLELTPIATPPAPPAPTTTTPTAQPSDPRLAPLIAMFPTLDTTIMASVLDSVNGDHDRAVDILLGMSDPNYIAETRPLGATPGGAPPAGETDEEMARRLAAEEEFESAWYPQHSGPPPGAPVEQEQPRARHGRGRGGAGPPPENDTFAQVQDQVLKFAETGKKTFMSFASKVRQKIQEFDNPNNPIPRHRDWNDPTYPTEEPVPTTPSYYDHTVNVAYQPPPGQRRTPQHEVTGFDLGDSAGSSTGTTAPRASAPMAVPAPAVSHGASAAASYDASRLGLLPKRPVSLIDTSTATKKTTVEDDDELEYVENPFEDKHS